MSCIEVTAETTSTSKITFAVYTKVEMITSMTATASTQKPITTSAGNTKSADNSNNASNLQTIIIACSVVAGVALGVVSMVMIQRKRAARAALVANNNAPMANNRNGINSLLFKENFPDWESSGIYDKRLTNTWMSSSR